MTTVYRFSGQIPNHTDGPLILEDDGMNISVEVAAMPASADAGIVSIHSGIGMS